MLTVLEEYLKSLAFLINIKRWTLILMIPIGGQREGMQQGPGNEDEEDT